MRGLLIYPPRTLGERVRWFLHSARSWWTTPRAVYRWTWKRLHPQPDWMYEALYTGLLPKGETEPAYRAFAPHCDALTLHKPGDCRYCDKYPEAQLLRLDRGVPFSGEPGAPDALFRPAEAITRWGGNRARR